MREFRHLIGTFKAHAMQSHRGYIDGSMGLLSQGNPLSWDLAKDQADYVREQGICQFLNQYGKLKDRQGDNLKWGDEIEYMMVEFDEEAKEAHLFIRAALTIEKLNERFGSEQVIWHPEFARYMLESTPGKPYDHSIQDLLFVEEHMKLRREQVEAVLKPNQRLISCSSFPRLGLSDCFPKNESYSNKHSQSKYFPDEAINPHPRFATLVENVRMRRGKKVDITVPIFRDVNTDMSDPVKTINEGALFPEAPCNGHLEPGFVYMDMMGFGMGCCCLQITMQAFSLSEARKIYDQLVCLAPIVMALTAATPIMKGYLVDTDCRWDVIAASVDDRTEEDMKAISKSRYDSVSRYISAGPRYKEEYNDLKLCYNKKVLKQLRDAGLDDQLACHLAHIFVRDPLVIYEELLVQDNEASMDHFENIQSTNWQTLRFKPPPAGSDIGWRVEFRSMEVQPTDFANASFSIVMILLTRAIFSINPNLYMPLSLVDINMNRSHKRDAVCKQKFYFRTNLFSDDSAVIEELSANEILNGKEGVFVGLIPLIYQYLDGLQLEQCVRDRLQPYIQLVSDRASCMAKTPARAIREFVQAHPAYKKDSKITQEITFDILKNFSHF